MCAGHRIFRFASIMQKEYDMASVSQKKTKLWNVKEQDMVICFHVEISSDSSLEFYRWSHNIFIQFYCL
jgi:hypothetical protein